MQEEGFVRAFKEAELPPGAMRTVQIDGDAVLLANVEGNVYGMGAICKHKGWDLSEGGLQGEKVVCAGHGTVWDLRTGKGEFMRPLEDEPLYDVKVEDGYLYVRRKS